MFTATATVTGGINPTGEVIFRIFKDANCVTEGDAPTTQPLVNGTATAQKFFTIPGTYYWRALYTGDANNNPATHPCNAANSRWWSGPTLLPPSPETITGDFVGPVTVDAGESVQIINARVVGSVIVNPGGSLVVLNSDLSGGIVANSPRLPSHLWKPGFGGPAQPVPGRVRLGLAIVIGDAILANGCAGNRFAGNVNLIGNFGILFETNIVSGNLTVNNGGAGRTTASVEHHLREPGLLRQRPARQPPGPESATLSTEPGPASALGQF